MAGETPILLCIFNRPSLTEQVFQRIAAQRPRRLLIVGDGPRPGHPTDAARVQACRQIVQQVNWDCQVSYQLSQSNLGCRRRMASGLTWAFEQVEELIVLEDDCLPDPLFFDYCQTMLERFRHDPQVGMICGDQFLDQVPTDYDAYLSKYAFVWGWASWRRAWRHYDLEMSRWPQRRDGGWLADRCVSAEEERYWRDIFQRQAEGQIDTWDYSWMFNCWDHDWLTVHPKHNLVANIGFGVDATHTTDPSAALANRPTLSQTHHSARPGEWTVDPARHWGRQSVVDGPLFRQAFCPQPDPPARRNRLSKWQKLERWFQRRLGRRNERLPKVISDSARSQ